jgi:hypothetical protein
MPVRLKRDLFRACLALLYCIALLALGAALLDGSSFYATALDARARHPDYWRYKPGGSAGLPLGVLGSGMMVLLLLYSVRKRLRLLRRFGPLARWLDVHIFLGTIGPLFIVLHSSLKAKGLVALSFWSMVAVALSGVFGRYLYLQIPRTRAGDELSLAQLTELDRRLSTRLRGEFGLDERRLARLEALTTPAPRRGLAAALASLIAAQCSLGRRLRQFRRECPTLPPRLAGELVELAREKALARRRIVLWDALHRLFHYWHVVHKPFAVVMYVFMVVHVVVASLTGYGWGR